MGLDPRLALVCGRSLGDEGVVLLACHAVVEDDAVQCAGLALAGRTGEHGVLWEALEQGPGATARLGTPSAAVRPKCTYL